MISGRDEMEESLESGVKGTVGSNRFDLIWWMIRQWDGKAANSLPRSVFLLAIYEELLLLFIIYLFIISPPPPTANSNYSDKNKETVAKRNVPSPFSFLFWLTVCLLLLLCVMARLQYMGARHNAIQYCCYYYYHCCCFSLSLSLCVWIDAFLTERRRRRRRRPTKRAPTKTE